MAKNKSLLQLSGRIGDFDFVNSKSYGPYVRARRGTYTPVTINDTLKINARRSAKLNQLASPLYRLFTDVASGCRDNRLWPRMLSRFKSCSSDNTVLLLQQLAGLNMHDGYPIGKIWSLPTYSIRFTGTELLLDIADAPKPRFSSLSTKANSFRYSISAFFLPVKKETWIMDETCTDWLSFSDTDTAYQFSFAVPKGKGGYVLCIKLDGGLNKRIIENMDAQRMMVLTAGAY